MNSRKTPPKKKATKPKTIEELEPCSIEDIILDNIAIKKVRLKIEGKNGTSKEVRCSFRKLDMQESLILGTMALSSEGTQNYQRKILSVVSLEPKFADPDVDSQWWKDNKIDDGFVRNYVRIINDHAGKNDFLLTEPNP